MSSSASYKTIIQFQYTSLKPLYLTHLWNPFSRIRIIMGKIGCTQIRTSSSCSSEKTKDVLIFFFFGGGGRVGIYCPEVSSAIWQKRPKKNLTHFSIPGEVVCQKMGLEGGSGGSFWLKCSPSIAEWFLEVANVSPRRNQITFGQNWPKSAMRIMQSLRACARTRAIGLTFFTTLSELIFHGGLPKKSSRSNRCRVIC